MSNKSILNEDPNAEKKVVRDRRTGKVKTYNLDFLRNFHTNEKFGLIFLNPPFEAIGSKFIMKSSGMVENGGYMCCVMSPQWRSPGTNTIDESGPNTYAELLRMGGFVSIHMYSGKDTNNLFGQNIGQVDTFVWQKGVTHTSTQITNMDGDTFTADLSKYPQIPPVFDCELYDTLFDQKNGLGFRAFTNPKNTGSYGPSVNKGIIDAVSGKIFSCNDANIEASKGKKVIVDQNFTGYYVDNVGDTITNQHRMFFFDTDEERDRIVYVIKYLLDNGLSHLLINRTSAAHIHFPKIRVK